MIVVAAAETCWNIDWFYKNFLKPFYCAYCWNSIKVNYFICMHGVNNAVKMVSE